jgi:hypothetical protein
MLELQKVVNEAKSHLDKGFVFVHVKDHWLKALLDGIEGAHTAINTGGVFAALRNYQYQGLCEGDEYDEIERCIDFISSLAPSKEVPNGADI